MSFHITVVRDRLRIYMLQVDVGVLLLLFPFFHLSDLRKGQSKCQGQTLIMAVQGTGHTVK